MMKSLLSVLAMQAMLVQASGTSFLPVSIGEDWQIPFGASDILRGFKLNTARGENAMKSIVFDGTIVNRPFMTSYGRSDIIQSTDELFDMLGIEGSLSVSYGPLISGEGAGSFLQNKVSSKNSVSIVYRARNSAYSKSVDTSTLVPLPDIAGLGVFDLTDHYGTHFIDQIVYGSQLDVIYTVTSTKDIDIQEIEAELKGKIGVGPLSVGFQAKFEKQEGEERAELELSITASASGITFGVPSNPTFDLVNQLIDGFNEEYSMVLDALSGQDNIDEEDNVLNQLSPVGFTVSSIADHVPALDRLSVTALLSRMEDLRETFHETLYWKAALQKTLDDVEARYSSPRQYAEVFLPFKAEVDQFLYELDQKVDECLVYRRLPIDMIIGSDTVTATPVPTSLVDSHVNLALRALIGLAYLPSPLHLGENSYEGIHYIGYALPTDDSFTTFTPWLSGSAVLDEGNLLVARANTPSDLEEKLNEGCVENFEFNPYLNIALNKPSMQSSTGYHGHAFKANDGNINGDYFGGNSVTHTNGNDQNAYWQVDLMGDYLIRKVDVYNRSHEYSSRLSDAVVVFLDADENQLHQETFGNMNGVARKTFVFEEDDFVTAGTRFVRIYVSPGKILSLAEVEVFGRELTRYCVDTLLR